MLYHWHFPYATVQEQCLAALQQKYLGQPGQVRRKLLSLMTFLMI